MTHYCVGQLHSGWYIMKRDTTLPSGMFLSKDYQFTKSCSNKVIKWCKTSREAIGLLKSLIPNLKRSPLNDLVGYEVSYK